MPIFNKPKKPAPTGPVHTSGGFMPAPSAAKHVPSLADADPEIYGALIAKIAELNGQLSEANTSKREAERILAAHEGPSLRVGVAELLGDDVANGYGAKVAAVRDARQRVADIEAAITIANQRLRDAKSAAARAVKAKVLPEWEKRVKALCKALETAQAAHIALYEMRQAVEAEDVAAALFGPWPWFLGDARDSKIASYLKEVGNAG